MRSLLAFAAAIACVAQSAAAQAVPSPASPASWAFVPCQIASLKVYATDRLPASPAVRTVTTAQGEQPVTMVDGYRILYILPPDEAMLNVKTEILDGVTWETEKKALTDNLAWMAATDPKIGTVAQPRAGSLDTYVVSNKALEGATLAIAELFNDARHLVTTIYFLNAEPAHRHFRTVPEFVALRDRIVRDFGRCPSLQGE